MSQIDYATPILMFSFLMAVLCVPAIAFADDAVCTNSAGETRQAHARRSWRHRSLLAWVGQLESIAGRPEGLACDTRGRPHTDRSLSETFPDHENVIVQVTFRWGELTGDDRNGQLLAIVSDLRPGPRGHKVEAWATSKSSMTKTGLVLKSSNDKGVRYRRTALQKICRKHLVHRRPGNCWR